MGEFYLVLKLWKSATIFPEIAFSRKRTEVKTVKNKLLPKLIFLHIFIKNSFKAIPKPSKFQSLIFQTQSPRLNSPNLSKSMLLRSIASIIFQITYKTQNLVKCQGTLSIKTQSIRKVNRKIYQTKHLSNSPTLNLLLVLEQN